MQVVRNYGPSDAYNYGLLAGKLAGQMYENRERRGAYKDAQNFLARETANNLDARNNDYKAALDAYTTQKDNIVGALENAYNNYNQDQSTENFNRAVELSKQYNPNFNANDAMGFTNTLNLAKSGELPVYQQTRNRAQTLAKGINPNTDFSQSGWANDTYQQGLDQANYYRNYENSNKGKTINGEGDNKFIDYSSYRANDPYSSTTPNPAAQRKNNVFVLNNGLPLDAGVMDALTRYIVAQGGY